MRLTKSRIDRIEAPPEGYELHWDSELPGFGLRVTAKGAKSFIAQGKVNGKARRITLGRFGNLTADQARKKARVELGRMADDVDPAAVKAERRAVSVTLGRVAENYKATRRTSKGLPLKASTKADIDKHLRRTFADWQKKPIAEISRELVRRRYLSAAKRSTAQANQAMRVLSALFNFAAEEYRRPDGSPLLIDNPVRILRAQSILRAVPARKRQVPLEQLGRWWGALQARRNDPDLAPVAKTGADLLAFIALTGLRLGEARALKWEHVNLDDSSMTIADPKNRQTIMLPLSDRAAEILRQRQSDPTYIFPAPRGKGYLKQPRGQIDYLEAETGIRVSAHDLRRTFRAVAGALNIELWRCKALMNHKQSQDVTLAHYADLSDVRNLKPEADQIARHFEQQRQLIELDSFSGLEQRE